MQPARIKGNPGSVYKVINMFPLSAVDSYRENPFVSVVTQKELAIL